MDRSGRLDGAADSAPGRRLFKLIYSCNAKVLSEALDDPDLDEKFLALLLRNSAFPASGIERVCREELFVSSYRVQAAIAQNPKTPERVALRFLPGLFWRDQLRVARDFRIGVVLRRKAERSLVERLPKMAAGEKIELARLATTEILHALVCERDRRILRACLDNPRATEETAVRLVNSANVEPTFLLTLAQMPRWFSKYGVKVALSRAERTPVPLVLRILPTLTLEDLVAIEQDDQQPEVVRAQAREIIGLKQAESSREK